MVVDDYRAIANALCRHLRVIGHDARAAYSGAAAVAEAAQFRPDIVLLDLLLPDLSGLDVARTLREQARGHIYIAAISTRIEMLHDVFDDHVQKPFGISRLAQILANANLGWN